MKNKEMTTWGLGTIEAFGDVMQANDIRPRTGSPVAAIRAVGLPSLSKKTQLY